MYEMHTLREVGDYLEAVGIDAGVTSKPYPTSDKFIEILDVDKRRLKQAAKLMSKDSGTFTLAAAKRLKDFAGEMDGEYAERAAEVIVALAELDKLHTSMQYKRKMAGLKNAAAKAYNSLKVWKLF